MSISRFFDEGVRDAERRLPFLEPLSRADEQAVLALAESSVVVGTVDRWVTRICGAWESSAVVGHATRLWSDVPSEVRLPAIGLALIVAATVHVSLVVWHERPAGWLWVMLPALAVLTGTLSIVFAGSRESRTPVD
ncbi:MAG: hypothetical protein ACRD2N_17920 [Vicinamibacterales bacterium]